MKKETNKEENKFIGKLKEFFSVKEKEENETKQPLLITDKIEIDDLMKKIQNDELLKLTLTVNQLNNTVHHLMLAQKEMTEFMVQVATTLEELEHIMDNKVILISNGNDETPDKISSRNLVDLMELKIKTEKKKMAN